MSTNSTPFRVNPARRFLRIGFLVSLLAGPGLIQAQTGAVDPSFTLGPIGVTIHQLAVQTDGHILAGGNFTSFHTTAISNLVRLNANGTVDTSFVTAPMTQFGGAANGTIYAVAAQPDGKVLVGGGFDAVGGVGRTNLVRLNANGSLDSSFDVSTSDAKVVWRLARQADGTTFVGGGFDKLGGVTRPGLARLRTDGTLDASFAPNLSPYIGANVHAIAVQSDGKILIGGGFATFSGSLQYFTILRLNTNGSVDSTFTPPVMPAVQTVRIFDIVIQADGRIVVAGSFTAIGGVSRQSIARLESNGNVDTTWPGPGVFSVNSMFRTVKAMQAVAQEKILIAGDFEQYNGETSEGIARLNADGTRDTSFNSPVGTTFRVTAMTIQPDGAILVGGALDVGPVGTSLVRLSAGVTPPTLAFSVQPGGVLRFNVPAGFRLQTALNLGATWSDVNGTSPIDVPMTDTQGIFRLKQ